VFQLDGEEEGAEPPVRGAHVGSAKTSPCNCKPQRGQIPENGAHSSNRLIWGSIQLEARVSRAIGVPQDAADVFTEEERGSGLIEDANDVGPDPPLVLDAFASAGDGVRLARPARSDAIHDAVEGSSIEL
jgi:hypothetical protein